MNSKTKKTLIVLLMIAAALFALWFWAIHSLFQDWGDQPYLYETSSASPDESCSVTVLRSDGAWPFGPARVQITAESDSRKKSYETSISDDGGSGHAEVQWLDKRTAQVLLRGSEQPDEIILVDFSGGEIDFSTSHPTTERN